MAGVSPTQRTIAYLKGRGIVCGICERWIPNPKLPGGGIRKDLFGFIDIISISPTDGVMGIQSCGSAFSEHYKKITTEKHEDAQAWLEAGGKIALIGWRKLKKKLGDGSWSKQGYWQPRICEITMEDLEKANANDTDEC